MNERRTFLARLAAAAAAFGVGSTAQAQDPGGKAASASTAATSATRWQPAREAKDDWYDQLPGKHRMVFDTVSPQGIVDATQFISNYFVGNRNGYGLDASDVAAILVMRHRAVQFAFTDAIWSKYGAALSESEQFTDPKTGAAPTTNVYRAGLENHIKRGLHLAVCELSTHRLSNFIARKSNGTADAVFKELTTNTLPNVHFAPAGIVALNRAQEHGYTVASVG